jgi:hypothetical protein
VPMIILNRITELIIKYRNSSIASDERKELHQWVARRTEHFLLFLDLIDDDYLHKECIIMLEGDKNANWKKIEQKILPTLSDASCPKPDCSQNHHYE